jgi:hypothetical protein
MDSWCKFKVIQLLIPPESVEGPNSDLSKSREDGSKATRQIDDRAFSMEDRLFEVLDDDEVDTAEADEGFSSDAFG